ncbi:hypothetical protein QTO34_017694 [Cnephaeus nilssonii]|uniref:Uncharacterized protein n=1 Tax=Cnephaeus nilssonii TaxID=3371016 RepID=A0AA40I1L5_CNENI|nr:hypothetical protein QTO34_017694 [Eptesicus nilssonii]
MMRTVHQGADTQCRNCPLVVSALPQQEHQKPGSPLASAAAVAEASPASKAALRSSEQSSKEQRAVRSERPRPAQISCTGPLVEGKKSEEKGEVEVLETCKVSSNGAQDQEASEQLINPSGTLQGVAGHYLFKCLINIKKEADDALVEMHWAEDQNRELMNQLCTCWTLSSRCQRQRELSVCAMAVLQHRRASGAASRRLGGLEAAGSGRAARLPGEKSGGSWAAGALSLGACTCYWRQPHSHPLLALELPLTPLLAPGTGPDSSVLSAGGCQPRSPSGLLHLPLLLRGDQGQQLPLAPAAGDGPTHIHYWHWSHHLHPLPAPAPLAPTAGVGSATGTRYQRPAPVPITQQWQRVQAAAACPDHHSGLLHLPLLLRGNWGSSHRSHPLLTPAPIDPRCQRVRVELAPSAHGSGASRSGAASRQGTGGAWRKGPGRGAEDGRDLPLCPPAASQPTVTFKGDKLPITLNSSFWGHAGDPDIYGEKLDCRPSGQKVRVTFLHRCAQQTVFTVLEHGTRGLGNAEGQRRLAGSHRCLPRPSLVAP